MRYLLAFLLLASASAQAAFNTITVTFTNRTFTGSNITVKGSTAIWTSAPLNGITWLQTNSIAGSATNLQRFIARNYPSLFAIVTNATNVIIAGTDLTIAVSDAYAYLTTNAAPTTNFHAVLIPWDTQPYATNRTNDADELIYGLNKYALTNAFSTNAQLLTNYLSLGPQTQTFSNKIALNVTNVNGITTNQIVTNAARINTANLRASGGFLNGLIVSNSPSLAAIASYFSDVYVSNSISVTGLVARGAGLNSVQIGVAAGATGTSDIGIGVSATAAGGSATAVGDGARALEAGASAFGTADAFYENATALGGGSSPAVANHTNATALGFGATANHLNSTAINQATTTDSNQVMLGRSVDQVVAPGVLLVNGPLTVTNGITNGVMRGTNSINAELSLVPRVNSTVIAGYASAINLGTNAYIRVTGASGAITNASFKGGYAGLRVLVEFVNPGLSCVLLDHSAIGAPTAAEKINNGTGALVNMTNNPAMFELMHNGTEWLRLWNSN